MLKRFRSRAFLPLLIAGLALSLVGITACGGKNAQDIVDDTFAAKDDQNVKSGKFNLTVKAENVEGVKELPGGEADLKLSGSFAGVVPDSKELPQLDLALIASAGKTNFAAGLVATDEGAFVSYQDTPYKVPKDLFSQFQKAFESQVKAVGQDKDQTEKLNKFFDKIGVDTKKWYTDLKKEGTEQVGGAETDKVTGKINVARFATDFGKIITNIDKMPGVPKETKDQAGSLTLGAASDIVTRAIKESVKDASFTINSGTEDSILRRLSFKATIVIPQEFQSQLQGLKGGDIVFDIELSDLNQPQSIKAPSGAKPFEGLAKKLGIDPSALSNLDLSGLSGAGAGGTSTNIDPESGTTTELKGDLGGSDSSSKSSASGAEAAALTKKYQQCISKAKDQEAQLKCVEMLNQ